jgi:hypothetical protein
METIGESVSAYRHCLNEKAAQVQAMLSADSFGDALFRMGYLLHSIQDLSAHEGITNAWHSSLASQHSGTCGLNPCNPDSDPSRISRASHWTDLFFLEASDWLGPAYPRMQAFNGGGPTLDEKRSVSINGLDISKGELLKDIDDYKVDLPADTLHGQPLPASGRWTAADGVGQAQQIEAIRIVAVQSLAAAFSRGIGYVEASRGQDFIDPVQTPEISRIRKTGGDSCSAQFLAGIKPMSSEVCKGVCNWPAAFTADDCSNCFAGIVQQQSQYQKEMGRCSNTLGGPSPPPSSQSRIPSAGQPGLGSAPAPAKPRPLDPSSRTRALTRGSTSTSFNEADLQRQRANAISSGDIETYNRLIDEHRLLYKQHGVDPCMSGFFPQDCSH